MAAAEVNRLGDKPLFDPDEGPNPELDLSWLGDELVQIDKDIDGIIYRKTLTWTAGNLTNISPWIEL